MNPTFVIAPGAWQSAEAFHPLQVALKARSYPSVSKSPPSVTCTDGRNADLDNDVEFVRNELLLPLIEEGKDIILVMHSFGGVYGGGAVKGLSKDERQRSGKTGGVLALIFVSAACVPVGMSLLETMGVGDELLPWVTLDEDTGKLTIPEPIPLMFHDLPPQEADRWAKTLKTHAIKSMKSKVTYAAFSDPVYEGKLAYLLCENDQTVPLHGQKKYMQLAGITLSASLPTSHMPFLDDTEKTADTLIELFWKIVHS